MYLGTLTKLFDSELWIPAFAGMTRFVRAFYKDKKVLCVFVSHRQFSGVLLEESLGLCEKILFTTKIAKQHEGFYLLKRRFLTTNNTNSTNGFYFMIGNSHTEPPSHRAIYVEEDSSMMLMSSSERRQRAEGRRKKEFWLPSSPRAQRIILTG